MARHSAMGGLVLLTILVGLVSVQGLDVVLTNNMSAAVSITCELEGTLPGDSRLIYPGQWYMLQVGDGSNHFQGLSYICVFAAADKPRTILEVFVGTGGTGNAPCNCGGEACPWSITTSGFSCAGFSHGWGN